MKRLLPIVSLVVVVLVGAFIACSGDDGSPVEPPDQPQGPYWPASWASGMAVGEITTFAGTGVAGWDGDGNKLDQSTFYQPIDCIFGPTRGLIFDDWQNHRIRQYQRDGTLKTVIGRAIIGDGPIGPDIGGDIGAWWPATDCALNHPTRIQEMSDGKILVTAWHNHKMRVLDLDTGMETVLIGRGPGCGGDGLTVDDVRLNQHSQGTEGPDGAIWILDQRNQVIRRVDVNANTCETVAGTLTPDCATALPATGYAGDGEDASQARFNFPTGPNPLPGGAICFSPSGNLFIADMGNHRIRCVDGVTNIINTVVGNGTAGYGGDGGPPTSAQLNFPIDIEFGPDGRLYIADSKNNAVRAVDFDANMIVTVAGKGTFGYSGDGGPATQAELANPWGVAFDYNGNLIIADTYNNVFRGVRLK